MTARRSRHLPLAKLVVKPISDKEYTEGESGQFLNSQPIIAAKNSSTFTLCPWCARFFMNGSFLACLFSIRKSLSHLTQDLNAGSRTSLVDVKTNRTLQYGQFTKWS